MSTFDIPGYSIIQPLNSGGMATVYLAEQKSLGRKVAIKVMADNLSKDQGFIDRFEQEARIASHLSHPNIVTIFDYGTISSSNNGSTLYLVMAYIEGQDLKSLQPKLTLVARLKIIQEIANALHYAHQQGVIHRDIKPQNILIEGEGSRAFLTDFGVAKAHKATQELTQTGMTLGTPHYMSPEQALGKNIDHRADIYSLGVVLYFLLTGRVPYEGESEGAIGLKHFTDPIPALPDFFECFQPIINKALAKKMEDRYQSAAEFAESVGEVSISNLATLVQSINQQSEAPTKLMPTAPTQRINAVLTKNKGDLTTVLMAGFFGAVTAIAVLWFFLKDHKDSQPTVAPTNTTRQPYTQPTATPYSPPSEAINATLSCTYKLANDWGNGWEAHITLNNNSDDEIQNWKAEFTLPQGATVTNAFVTDIKQNGQQITFIPRDWNRNVKAQATLDLGFQGKGAPAKQMAIHCSGN